MVADLKKISILIVILFAFLFSSCKKNEITDPEIPIVTYNPSVGNTAESFGYAATVSNLTISDEYTLKFSGSSLNIGLVISGYSTGSVQVQVIAKDGQIVFDRTSNSNTVQGSTLVPTSLLDKVKIKYSIFTGVVSFGINPRN